MRSSYWIIILSIIIILFLSCSMVSMWTKISTDPNHSNPIKKMYMDIQTDNSSESNHKNIGEYPDITNGTRLQNRQSSDIPVDKTDNIYFPVGYKFPHADNEMPTNYYPDTDDNRAYIPKNKLENSGEFVTSDVGVKGPIKFVNMKGTYVPEGVIDVMPITFVEECERECAKRGECTHFTVDARTGICYLKGSYWNKDRITGFKDGNKFKNVKGVDITGFDLPMTPEYGESKISLLKCRRRCIRDPKCRWYTYMPSGNFCWMNTAIKYRDGLTGFKTQ